MGMLNKLYQGLTVLIGAVSFMALTGVVSSWLMVQVLVLLVGSEM